MATAIQRKEGVGIWAETFPTQQTTFKESLMFMKRLLGVAICNIAYLRMMFPNDAFVDKSLEGIHLKILKSSNDNPQVVHLINCLKGVFDALDKKYLKTLVFMIHPDPKDTNKVLDSYTFHFSYHDGNEISIYSNNKKISTTNMADKTKEATLKMLRTLIVSSSTLEPLPSAYSLSMKLFYYDDVTPSDYEPPSFEPTEEGEPVYSGTPMDIAIGSVSTVYHTVNLQLTTGVNRDPKNATQDDYDIEAEVCPAIHHQESRSESITEESLLDLSLVESQRCDEAPPLAPSQKANKIFKNFSADRRSPSGVKGSKRKLKKCEDLAENVCDEASKLNIEGPNPKKQSKSKHLHFGVESTDCENSEELFKAKRRPKPKKHLY